MTNEEARNILLTSVHPQTAEEAEAIGIAVHISGFATKTIRLTGTKHRFQNVVAIVIRN